MSTICCWPAATTAGIGAGGRGLLRAVLAIVAALALLAARAAPAVLGALLAACAAPATEHFYLLDTEGATNPVLDRPLAEAVVVEINAIPEAVDRPQLVWQQDAHELRLLEQSRWAEPLRAGIGRTLVHGLQRVLPSTTVSDNAGSVMAPLWLLEVRVNRLDGGTRSAAHLDLQWALLHVAVGGSRLQRAAGQLRLERGAVATPAELVLAWSSLLTEAARGIAPELVAVAAVQAHAP